MTDLSPVVLRNHAPRVLIRHRVSHGGQRPGEDHAWSHWQVVVDGRVIHRRDLRDDAMAVARAEAAKAEAACAHTPTR